jgi:peroxiredoxin
MVTIRSRRTLITLPISILMLLVLLASPLLVQESSGEEMTPIPMISGIEMLKVGDTAPEFAIQDLEGNEFNMKEALSEGKGVLIFFWSIFCEPCKQELPIIQELTDAYMDKGIKVVGVVLDGTPMKEAISAFIGQENYSFRVLIDELNPDESFKISDPYGVAGTPTLYFIDSSNEVKFSKIGRASKEEIEAVIKQAL